MHFGYSVGIDLIVEKINLINPPEALVSVGGSTKTAEKYEIS